MQCIFSGAAIMAIAVAPAFGQCDPVSLGAIGGRAVNIEVEGDYAYTVQLYADFYVHDLTTPTPTRVASLDIAESTIGLDIEAGFAYVLSRIPQDVDQLHVIDISDPLAPTPVASIEVLDFGRDVVVDGDRAYVLGSQGVRIVDVSDPAAPVLLGAFDLDVADDLAAVDDLVYIAAADGLFIVDVADPTAPSIIGSYPTTDNGRGVVVVDDVAYVAADSADLQIIDVSEPTAPALISSLPLAVDALDIRVHKGTAFVRTFGLYAIDVADPAAPEVVSFLPKVVGEFAIDGDRAYAASSGVQVIDIADPAAMSILAESLQLADAQAVVVAGGVAHVADDAGGYRTVDVTEPADMVVASVFDTYAGFADEASDVQTQDGLVYVLDVAGGGLWVFDETDPSTPVGHVLTPGLGRLTLAGDLAYVARGSAGFTIIDIADPTAPMIVKTMDLEESVGDVLADCDRLYVANNDGGVKVFDTSDPLSPMMIGQYVTVFRVSVLARDGKVLFAGGEDVVWSLDIRDPDPAFLDLVVLPDIAVGLTASDGVLYVAGRGAGVIMLDARDPRDLDELATISTPDESLDVERVGDALYIAQSQAGLQVFDVSSCTPCQADINRDGALNILDFITFQLRWQADEVGADCNADGLLDITDFVCFASTFQEGC